MRRDGRDVFAAAPSVTVMHDMYSSGRSGGGGSVSAGSSLSTSHANVSLTRPPLHPQVSLRSLAVADSRRRRLGGEGGVVDGVAGVGMDSIHGNISNRSSGGKDEDDDEDDEDDGGVFVDSAVDERRSVFSSSSTRDAVLAYLAATDRHDVVMAMMRDEAVAAAAAAVSRGKGTRRGTATPLHDDNEKDKDAAATYTRRDRDAHAMLAAQQQQQQRRRTRRATQALLLRGLAHKHAVAAATAATASNAHGYHHPHHQHSDAAWSWHAAHVLDALHGLEQGAHADMALLHAGFVPQLTAQRALHGLPPLAPDMAALLAAQARTPLWSADEDATVVCAPPAASAATGGVLTGTLNALVEQLTRVRVTPGVPTPLPQRVTAHAFGDAFLRQHRQLMPSRVLLAKLLERAQMPLSVRLGVCHFCAHGITIHVTHCHDGVTAYSAVRPRGDNGSSSSRRSRRHCQPCCCCAGGGGVAGQALSSSSPVSATRRDGRNDSSSSSGGALMLWRSQSEAVSQQPSTTATATTTTTTRMYARDGTLWLTVLRVVQTRVLTTLLYWLQHHPCHFDQCMRQCVLHMAEYATLQPVVWADCPPAYAQLGAALRDAVVVAARARARVAHLLRLPAASPRRHVHNNNSNDDDDDDDDDDATATHATRVSSLLRLSRMGYAERMARMHDTTPPTLRRTTRTHDGHKGRHDDDDVATMASSHSDTPSADDSDVETTQLPLFVLHDMADGGYALDEGDAQLPFTSVPTYSDGSSHTMQTPSTSSPLAAAAGDSSSNSDVYDTRRRRAEAALREFLSRTSDAYVKGLTAAHQRLLCSFAVDDVRALSYRYTPSYITSTRVRRSRLGAFLRTSAELTRWTASLMLHAAFLDGVLANTARREALTLSASFVDGGAAAAAAAAAALAGGGVGSNNSSMAGLHSNRLVAGDAVVVVSSDDDDEDEEEGDGVHSDSDASRRRDKDITDDDDDDDDGSSSSDDDDDSDTSSNSSGGRGNKLLRQQPLPKDSSERDDATRPRIAALTAVVDSDGVGEQQQQQQNEQAMASSATTLTASSFARRGSTAAAAAAAVVVVPALPSLGKLFVRVLHRVMELIVGFLRVNNIHASYSVFRGLQHPYVLRLLNHPQLARRIGAHTLQQLRHLDSFYAADARYSMGYYKDADDEAADNKDDDDGGDKGSAGKGGRGGGRPTAARRTHHRMRHTFREYLNAVSDNTEYPTVPLLQHYLSELSLLHTLEPTLLTVPYSSHDRSYHCCTTSDGDDDDDDDEHEHEHGTRAAPSLTLVHWRKLSIEDEILQRIAAFQRECQHYVWCTSTVLRSIVRDVHVEAAHAAELRTTVVRDGATLRALASELLTVLDEQQQQRQQQRRQRR